jgi:hypothetical protein
MWIDERGSQVLELGECRRLLALAAKEQRHGHLGIAEGADHAPTVLPVNYTMSGPDIVVVVGEGLFQNINNRLVAFEVDGVDRHGEVFGTPDETAWSVLARGLASEELRPAPGLPLPIPEVAEPGHRRVRIRTDLLTGRKLGHAPATAKPQPTQPPSTLHLVKTDIE